jgi:hypothetical protein
MPSLTSCVREGLLLVALRRVGLCCMASCCAPPPRHAPWGVLACAGVGCCGVSFVAYCLPPVVMSRRRCLSHHAVVVSLPMLWSLLSLPFPQPRRPPHSPFPPREQLLVAVVGGAMWWWPLSSWPSLFGSRRSMFIRCVEGVWSVIASCWKHKR